jgi:hypothetical protein
MREATRHGLPMGGGAGRCYAVRASGCDPRACASGAVQAPTEASARGEKRPGACACSPTGNSQKIHENKQKTLGFSREQRVHVSTPTAHEHTRMTTEHNIPETRNEGYGFYGTMRAHAATAWPLAILTIQRAIRRPRSEIRAFLDSPGGRHFANEVEGHLIKGFALADAIEAATQGWMRKSARDARLESYGLMQAQPMLRKLVIEAGDYEAAWPDED